MNKKAMGKVLSNVLALAARLRSIAKLTQLIIM
jgi:hypothetical protein